MTTGACNKGKQRTRFDKMLILTKHMRLVMKNKRWEIKLNVFTFLLPTHPFRHFLKVKLHKILFSKS